MELTRAQIMAVFSIAINHAPVDARFTMEKDGSGGDVMLSSSTGEAWSIGVRGDWKALHSPVAAA